MTVERSSLRQANSLPASDAAMTGGTNGSTDGASDAALARGYTMVPQAEDAMDPPPEPPVTAGFLTRPRGWER